MANIIKLQITFLALCLAIVSHAAIKTPCAKIILNSGRVIEAEILEVNPVEIRYKKCGQTTDVEYVLNKASVLVIKNSQDEVIFIHKKDEYDANMNDSQKKHELFSILAFIFAILYPVLGLIFMLISSARLNKSPHKYKKISNSWLSWAKGILTVYGIIILVVLVIVFRFGGF